MGSCLSKKGENLTAVAAVKSVAKEVKVVVAAPAQEKTVEKTEHRKAEDEVVVKKDISVMKHRKSYDKQMQQEQKQQIQIQKLPTEAQSRADQMVFGTPVRTSSCTREEVDAILIQCGRLSRSSSANTPGGKKYSGSKRSFDFDNEGIVSKDEEDEMEKLETQSQQRQSRSRSSPMKPGRRRTPSRERDSSQQRSGSRERSVAGSGRRVSRSPGRRSDTPVASGVDSNNGGTRPGKMVSVPASLTSALGAGNEQSTVRKIVVKRDARSPRSQSPAHIRQPPTQPQTLSRSNSRKTDQSPYRRNPLSEIDNNHSSQQTVRKANQSVEDGGNRSLSNSKRAAASAGVETKVDKAKAGEAKDNSLQPKSQRSRSWSRSRDFDELSGGANPNTSSYASILLEDIQTFHQKSNNNSNVAFSLPQCVSKACSIMEAVADLTSTTSSSVVSNEEKKRDERRKLAASDDLIEPSLHKYVTMRRGSLGGDEESSGSNSVAGGGQQRWGSPSEPNSVESTACLTSKASKQRPCESSRIIIPVRS